MQTVQILMTPDLAPVKRVWDTFWRGLNLTCQYCRFAPRWWICNLALDWEIFLGTQVDAVNVHWLKMLLTLHKGVRDGERERERKIVYQLTGCLHCISSQHSFYAILLPSYNMFLFEYLLISIKYSCMCFVGVIINVLYLEKLFKTSCHYWCWLNFPEASNKISHCLQCGQLL